MRDRILTIFYLILFIGVPLFYYANYIEKKYSNESEGVVKNTCENGLSPIIDVNQHLLNTLDSGEGKNYWAWDDIERTIRVYPTGESGAYCVLVDYDGTYKGIKGQMSPGQTAQLSGEEMGRITGGYKATLHGNLLPEAYWKMEGDLGMTDYRCDLEGSCPGAVNWITQYFESGYDFSYDKWNWVYESEDKQHKWINGSDGSYGDVL